MTNLIHPAAERIIKYMAGKTKYKIGMQGVSYCGKLYYMILRNERTGQIQLVYFQGSLEGKKMDIVDCDNDTLNVIAEEIGAPWLENALYNIIAD